MSPSTVSRVLKASGRLERWNARPSRKGKGFSQPSDPHEHWHSDIAYINISGTFYYVCSMLDGYSKSVVHWEIRESMREADAKSIVQRARERDPGVRPRLISDNGPQFIARDLKEFIRILGMTHVRTSPSYPQSNGKIERWHKTLKRAVIRSRAPSSLEEASQLVGQFVDHCNNVRLHSVIGYVTPADKHAGREEEIWRRRNQRSEAATKERRQRQARREAAA